MKLRSITALLVAAATAIATACGGGGGGGGIGGTGAANVVAYGTITAFGSVWVNGVEYDTTAATFVFDDKVNPVQGDLSVGMVVRVDASSNGNKAESVGVDGAIKGRIEQVLDANRMVVMGQVIQIDPNSRPASTAGFVAGDFVEVHGLVVSDGTVAAGFFQKKVTLPTPPFAVKGYVKAHDPAARTLRIGTLDVSYTTSTTVNDLPAGDWNGRLVEVKGTACAGGAVCGTLSASRIEPSGLVLAQIEKAEVEGFVTAVSSATQFVVGTQKVITSASTRYEGGVAADLAVGSKLEVEGPVSGGVLTATKVSFRDSIRFEGNIAAFNAGRTALTLQGLPGVTVRLNSLTGYDTGSAASLAVGNHLRIRARPTPVGGEAVAIRVELRSTSPDTRLTLQGPLTTAPADPIVTVLGFAVDTAAIVDGNFRDASNRVLGRAGFFSSVQRGTIVKAQGDLAGGAAAWDEIEIEQ